jgi:hypothetical protein
VPDAEIHGSATVARTGLIEVFDVSELGRDEELTAAQAMAKLQGFELPEEPEARAEDQPVPEGFPYLPVESRARPESSRE